MLKIVLFIVLLFHAVLAESGYYFNFSTSAPYNCYFGTTARSCAANCDYYSAIPPEYCSLMPTLGGCSADGCSSDPSAERTYCAGCPTAPQYQCEVDGSTPNCSCSYVSIPLPVEVCGSTGTFDGVAVADGASMSVSNQISDGSYTNIQYFTNITNGTMLINDEDQGIVQFSAGTMESGYYPASLSCAFDGVNFAVYNTSSTEVNFDCNFTSFIAVTNRTVQAIGTGIYSGSQLWVQGESSYSAYLDGRLLCNGTGMISTANSFFYDRGDILITNQATVTIFGVMDLLILAGHTFVNPNTTNTVYGGNTVSFPDGSYQLHTWSREQTTTDFIAATYYFNVDLTINGSYFNITTETTIIRSSVSTNCSADTIMNFYGYTSFADPVVCDLAGFNSTLTANMTMNSTILPDGSLVVPGGSQVVSGNMTVDVAANNTDLEALFVMYLNPLDTVNNSVLVSEYLDSYLIDFSALKATLVDPVPPAVSFIDESVDLGHGKWLVCNNTYFTSEGVLLIGDQINITAGSYLALSQPDDLVSYITIATEYSFNACTTSLALINGTTVTCLLNSTTKSTNGFEEQYFIYLNEGGTLDPATGNVLLVNGSQYNYTDGSTTVTLQFNQDNVTWYFNNNSVNVLAGIPIQAVNRSADPTVFDQVVIIISDGTVYSTDGQVLGYFDADGSFQPPIPTPPLPVIPSQCKNTSMNLFIVNRRSSCAAFGWIPAAVDTSNFDAVSKLIYNCGGPGAQAAIGSWQGSDYGADFITNYLVFTVGYVGGGGGAVSVAATTDGIPFVCQSN